MGGGKRELGGCSNRGKKREEMRRMEIVGWSTKRRWCERETEKNREDERDKTWGWLVGGIGRKIKSGKVWGNKMMKQDGNWGDEGKGMDGQGEEEGRGIEMRNDVQIPNLLSTSKKIKISWMTKSKSIWYEPAFHSDPDPSVSGVVLESERPSVPEGTRLSTCSVRIAWLL